MIQLVLFQQTLSNLSINVLETEQIKAAIPRWSNFDYDFKVVSENSCLLKERVARHNRFFMRFTPVMDGLFVLDAEHKTLSLMGRLRLLHLLVMTSGGLLIAGSFPRPLAASLFWLLGVSFCFVSVYVGQRKRFRSIAQSLCCNWDGNVSLEESA